MSIYVVAKSTSQRSRKTFLEMHSLGNARLKTSSPQMTIGLHYSVYMPTGTDFVGEQLIRYLNKVHKQ